MALVASLSSLVTPRGSRAHHAEVMIRLCAPNKVKIRRGIFQGDSLSPLLFVLALFPLSMILRKVSAGYEMTKDGCRISHLLFMDDLKLFAKNEKEIDSLVQTVRIFSDDIGMKFGLEKCAAMTMMRGKRVHSDGIALPDGTQLRALDRRKN